MTLTIIRTPEQIAARAKEKLDSPMDGEPGYLIAALPFVQAQPFLTEEGIAEGEGPWSADQLTPEKLDERIRNRLDFALDKEHNHRGISSSLAADYLTALVFLTCNDEALEDLAALPYENYGAPQVKGAAIMLGYQDYWEQHVTDEVRRMAMGLPCEPGCQEGCSW